MDNIHTDLFDLVYILILNVVFNLYRAFANRIAFLFNSVGPFTEVTRNIYSNIISS